MGLDMYLERRSYVKNWEHTPPEERHSVRVLRNGAECSIKPDRVSYVIEQVAYWRKANQIHKWFVDNAQSGDDNGEPHEVTRAELQELVDLCKQVLASVETVPGTVHDGTQFHADGRVEPITHEGVVIAQAGLAAQLLPTQSGFFFGGTAYDEYYLEDLRNTIAQLEPILAIENDDATYEYTASW